MATISCDSCRRHKLKCDGQTPCGRCAAARRLCHFASSEEQPLMSEPGPRALVHPSQQHDSEKLRLLEKIFAQLHPDIQLDDLDLLRNFKTQSTHNSQDANRPEMRRRPSPSEATARSEVDDFPANLDGGKQLGQTPVPAASVTVINQGQTRESKPGDLKPTSRLPSEDSRYYLLIFAHWHMSQISKVVARAGHSSNPQDRWSQAMMLSTVAKATMKLMPGTITMQE